VIERFLLVLPFVIVWLGVLWGTRESRIDQLWREGRTLW
jgi:hypothetical protein